MDALELHYLSRLSQQFSEVDTTAIVIGSDRDPDPVGRLVAARKCPSRDPNGSVLIPEPALSATLSLCLSADSGFLLHSSV